MIFLSLFHQMRKYQYNSEETIVRANTWANNIFKNKMYELFN